MVPYSLYKVQGERVVYPFLNIFLVSSVLVKFHYTHTTFYIEYIRQTIDLT